MRHAVLRYWSIGGKSVKKTLIVVIDLVIMGLILFFIIQYANAKMRESNESATEAFEKMTVTAEQIITNYLEDEQHLCDIWANYINRSAEGGNPMTAVEAISFVRKAPLVLSSTMDIPLSYMASTIPRKSFLIRGSPPVMRTLRWTTATC